MSALGGRLIARINCMVPVKSMFILVGLSGSGKSTWIQSFIEKHNLRNYALASADEYFSLSGNSFNFSSNIGTISGSIF